MSGIEQTIRRYRILGRIASGGMGVVYRAEDLTLHRLVALKFLSPDTTFDEEYRARFLREARVAAGLNHQNTCTVYEVGEVGSLTDSTGVPDSVASPGTLFIAMEFIEGETLASWISRAGRLSVPQTLEVGAQIAAGLSEAHRRQIVHRDLKPQNVMVAPGGLVKIVDFGLAKPLRPMRRPGSLASTSEMISAELDDGAVIGTCAYMSPEQASRKTVDPRSDVFSFGILLYEMLTGQLPFRGDTPTAVLAKILEAEPDFLPFSASREVPAPLLRMIRKCLEKQPEDRYADARDLVAELSSVTQHISGSAKSPALLGAWLPESWISGLSHTQTWIGVLAVLLIIAGGLTWVGRRILNTPTEVTASPLPAASSDANRLETRSRSVSRSNPVSEIEPGPPAQASLPAAYPGTAATTKPTPPVPTSVAPRVPRWIEPNASVAPTSIATSASPVSSPAAQTMGVVSLESTPQASVTLDGKLIGITPLRLEAEPGGHLLVMTSPDGARWRGRVEVAAGAETAIRRELNATGRLTITSDIWAEVSIDGGPAEQTPVDFPRIAAGLHDVRISREGYVTHSREIVIEEGRASYLRIALEKQP